MCHITIAFSKNQNYSLPVNTGNAEPYLPYLSPISVKDKYSTGYPKASPAADASRKPMALST